MKKLQAGLRLIQARFMARKQPPVVKKNPRALSRPPYPSQPLTTKLLPQPEKYAPKPLGFPVYSSLEVLRQRTRKGLRRLEHQGTRINQLSAELETAVLELKAIASQVNRDWRAIQAIQHPSRGVIIPNICEYQTMNVPTVRQKPSGSFVLTSRPVDLFKAERDAALLATALRRRARRKRLQS